MEFTDFLTGQTVALLLCLLQGFGEWGAAQRTASDKKCDGSGASGRPSSARLTPVALFVACRSLRCDPLSERLEQASCCLKGP